MQGNLPYFQPCRMLAFALLVPALLLTRVCEVNAASAGMSPEASTSSVGASPVATGYFSARYVFRSAETASQVQYRDQDVFGELRVDVASPQTSRYEFHFLGTVRSDADNNQDVKTFDPLEDIGNSVEARIFGNIYEAHVDINNPLGSIVQIRFGRQSGTRDEWIYFDGLAADVRLSQKVNMTLYGGAAVHFYEIDNGQGIDLLGGAGIDYAPSAWTGVSLDYLSVSDKRNYLQFTDQGDNLLSLRLWQRFTRNFKATAKVRYQDSDLRDLNVRLLCAYPEAAFELGAGYFRQFNTQQQQTNELSPLWDVMGPVYPYQTADIKVRKYFGTRFAIDAGYVKRLVNNSSEKGTFNHDYGRAILAFTMSDLFTPGLSMTLSGDQWSSEGNDYLAGGADITYRTKKRISASVGTYYSLYKYDEFLPAGEHDRIRTYYLSAKAPLARQLLIDLRYELEKGVDDFTILKAGVRYDF